MSENYQIHVFRTRQEELLIYAKDKNDAMYDGEYIQSLPLAEGIMYSFLLGSKKDFSDGI